jgi:hypothetical protein
MGYWSTIVPPYVPCCAQYNKKTCDNPAPGSPAPVRTSLVVSSAQHTAGQVVSPYYGSSIPSGAPRSVMSIV